MKKFLLGLRIAFVVILVIAIGLAITASFFIEAKTTNEKTMLYNSEYQSATAFDENFKSPYYIISDAQLGNGMTKVDYSYFPEGASKEIFLPSGLRDSGIGLFVCTEGEGGEPKYTKTTTLDAYDLIDESKPIVVFIHGMQMNYGYANEEIHSFMLDYIKGGYNVLEFYWSQFADEPLPDQNATKLWGTNGKVSSFLSGGSLNKVGMRWLNEDGVFVTDDVPNCSLTEIFGAYYLDFMSRIDFKGSEIRLMGHSLGGQFSCAVASYLLAKESEGLFNPAYLFDRVTLMDPYISQSEIRVDCNWLGKNLYDATLDENGKVTCYKGTEIPKIKAAIDVCADAVEACHERGIAVEIVPAETGYVYSLASMSDPSGEQLKRMYKNATVLWHRTDWVTDTLVGFNDFHCSGRACYTDCWNVGKIYDNAMENPSDYTVSPTTPTAYIYARSGIEYKMEENMTEDIRDDVISSVNVDCAKIAGFAFEDTNGNNWNDERIQSRIEGAKVELYMVNGNSLELVKTAITGKNGYYCFDIDSLYANGFNEFRIRVVAPDGYTICARSDKAEMMNNDVNPDDSYTDDITIAHRKHLTIINVGVKKIK